MCKEKLLCEDPAPSLLLTKGSFFGLDFYNKALSAYLMERIDTLKALIVSM